MRTAAGSGWRASAGELRVEVADTGTGLAADRRPGVGLSSMRERAEELGGTFEVGSAARAAAPSSGRGCRSTGTEESEEERRWRATGC